MAKGRKYIGKRNRGQRQFVRKRRMAMSLYQGANRLTGNFSKAQHAQFQRIGGRAGYGSVASPFPANLFTVMTYTETINAAQTVGGTPVTIQYRANGPYDPRAAVGGIQPRYFDSLLGDNGSTAPYRNYRVHACQIKVTCFNLNTSVGGGSVFVSVIPARSTVTGPSTVDEMRERPYAKQIAIGPVPSWRPPTLKHFTKIKTHLGVKDLIDVPASAALFNTVPQEEVWWNISLCAVDPTSTGSIRYQITLKYFVQLYTLGDVADS